MSVLRLEHVMQPAQVTSITVGWVSVCSLVTTTWDPVLYLNQRICTKWGRNKAQIQVHAPQPLMNPEHTLKVLFCFVLFCLRHYKSVQHQAKENCSQKAWVHLPPPGLYTILHLVEEPDRPSTTNLALGNTHNSHPSSELPSLYQAGKPIYISRKGFLICKTGFNLTK